MLSKPNIKWLHSVIIIFFLAFVPRYIIIKNSEEFNKHTDLQLYINAGLLIVNNINPYDFSDNVNLRKELRLNASLNQEWLRHDQDKWNYYTSSNLPASQLYYGAVEYLANSNPLYYRIIFAIVDSILSVFIFAFIIQFWNGKSFRSNIAFAVFLGALNPILLYWGALIPQDKGLQILLMIASLLFAQQNKLIWSAVFLGLAVCFKGLGIFLVPLCLYYICDSPNSLKDFLTSKSLRRIAIFGFISFLTFGILFIPFIPEVIGMMGTRLSSNLSGTPQHSSIWTIPYELWPSGWSYVRIGFIIFFISLITYGSYKRRLDIQIVTATVIVLFVDISLNMGSLDRMNIGFLVSILILGTSKFSIQNQILGGIYLSLGLLALTIFSQKLYLPGEMEKFDADFSLYMVLLLTSLLFYIIFSPGVIMKWGGVAAIALTFSYVLWDAKKTANESIVQQILADVGSGYLAPDEVTLTSGQKRLALALIRSNPSNYNNLQIAIVSPEVIKMMSLIRDVGLGEINADSVFLSDAEQIIVDSIISLNPNNYNLGQRSLTSIKSLLFEPKYSLREVGLGKIDPDSVILTNEQISIIDSIISLSPNDFNVPQKSLLQKKSETFYLLKILREVGYGRLHPDSVRLSSTNHRILDSIISSNPKDYNDGQKSLLIKKDF